MKAVIASFYLVMIAITAAAYTPLQPGQNLVGTIGVGSNRGTVCELSIETALRDLNGFKFSTKFKQQLLDVNKQWKIQEQDFPLQNYGGSYEGSIPKVDLYGNDVKISIRLFLDPRTKRYKAIFNENKLTGDSTGKFTICENMYAEGPSRK